MKFTLCIMIRCVNFSIIDDLTNEPEERFTITLTKTLSFITLSAVDGELLVVDYDGKKHYC